MKVVYSWLQDFVAVTATPGELASRLALSGTNIAGVENGPFGAVIDAEITSNRPDCLSHYGVAREVGALYKIPLKPVSPKPAEGPAKAGDAVKVEIRSPELCGRFTARLIRGVKIQPSPKWLKDRLEACGVASINNVVDVSNYVMLELGHPLHTFDYDKVRDHSIVVRAAAKEKIKTLDGLERQLDSGTCVICDGDGSRVVGIGGIVGGAVGNIVDRFHYQFVVDFIDLHWWPVFNVADSCITVCVALLVVSSIVRERAVGRVHSPRT